MAAAIQTIRKLYSARWHGIRIFCSESNDTETSVVRACFWRRDAEWSDLPLEARQYLAAVDDGPLVTLLLDAGKTFTDIQPLASIGIHTGNLRHERRYGQDVFVLDTDSVDPLFAKAIPEVRPGQVLVIKHMNGNLEIYSTGWLA